MRLDEVGSLLFGLPSNLSNHNDTLRLRIREEDFETIDEVGSVEWISSNTNAQRLPESDRGRLVDSLIGQSSRSRDDT